MTELPNDYYRYLFDCSSFAIIGTDCEGIIHSWNLAAEKIFERSGSEMNGHPIGEIVPEERRPLLERALKRAVTRGQMADFEVEYQHETSKVLVLAVVLTPVLDAGKQVQGLAAWIRDISNRRELETKLLEAEKMASLGTLASGIAHHFNNIIGGVATFVDFALTSHNPDATERALKMTAEAANRIGDITRSLLTFAEKDNHQTDKSDVTEVILTFTHLVEKPLAEKDIKLELHLEAVPVVEVIGSRLHQMLGNLLDNAENAMDKGGTVRIGLCRDENDVVLTFTDSGCGIAAKDLPHVFDPFFTTRGTLRGGNQKSAGLGLSVVHGIVRELGGDIGIESKLNQGTTFTIRFPIHKRNPNPDKPENPKM
jgi:PAS domain S-box-containing protein